MRAGRGALVFGALAVVLGAACRPEVEYNAQGRGSADDAARVLTP